MCRRFPDKDVPGLRGGRGGGNSAGQAVIFLAGQVSKLYLRIRGDDLGKSMSRCLIQRIEQTPNVELLTNTEFTAMRGEDHLHAVETRNTRTGDVQTIELAAVFSFIGVTPRTDWVFAAGDVRMGLSRRVAAAVGEGAMAVQLVHEYLKDV